MPSDRAPAPDEVQDQHDNADDKQDVDQPASDVEDEGA